MKDWTRRSFSNNKKNVCGAHTRRQSAEECSIVFELIDALISWPFIPPLPAPRPLFPTVPCSDRVAALFRSKPRMGRWNIFSLLEVEERRRDISANSSSTRFPFTLRFRITSTDNNRRGSALDDDAHFRGKTSVSNFLLYPNVLLEIGFSDTIATLCQSIACRIGKFILISNDSDFCH